MFNISYHIFKEISMLKKFFSIFFTVFLLFSLFSINFTASAAYKVTGIDIEANAGALISLDTGEIIFEKNMDKKVYPASITKIMTAVVVLESGKFKPKAKITMTREILDMVLGTGSAVSNLQEGEEITQLDLMYLVVMSSFGDCTYLAAQYYGGSVENFVDKMNAKAKELGLKGTHYQNPVGLHDDENYTTVRDIYTLTSYALKFDTFKTICETSRYTMPATNMSGERTLTSTNNLQNANTPYYYQYAKGVKTGYTDEAGRCLVSTANYNGYNYMCILMGCPVDDDEQFVDSAELYRWAFNNFSFKEVANSTEPVCEIPVELSLETDYVSLYFKKPFISVLPNEADDSTIVVKTKLKAESIEAPVKKGEVLGTADVIYAEQVIGTVDLVAGDDVDSSKLLVGIKYIKEFFSSSYMKILYIAIAIFIFIFIILCIKLNMALIKKRKVKYIPYKEKERNRHGK